MSNHRNRPYLVLGFKYILGPGQKSNQVGFGTTASWKPLETVAFVERLSRRDLMEAHLILDLLENKVIKNREGDLDAKTIFDAVTLRYQQEIKQALLDWASQSPENLQRLRELGKEDTSGEQAE